MWSYGRTPYRKTLVENVLQDIEQKSLRCEVPDYMPQQLGALLTGQGSIVCKTSIFYRFL